MIMMKMLSNPYQSEISPEMNINLELDSNTVIFSNMQILQQ